MNYELTYVPNKLISVENMSLYQTMISEEKSKIDEVDKQWNRVKRNIHDYEYIYTSPNKNRNLSQIVPISRSYFKLKEMIVDFKIHFEQSIIFCPGKI